MVDLVAGEAVATRMVGMAADASELREAMYNSVLLLWIQLAWMGWEQSISESYCSLRVAKQGEL